MNTTLFNDIPEKVRTLGFYQPFCSLMIHGKIETRWVREGKKPPFPLGKYLFYSTAKSCDQSTLFDWCGADIMLNISQTLESDDTRNLNSTALATGVLKEVRPLVPEDEPLAFVKYIGKKTEIIKGEEITKVQWALIFEDVKIITPFKWEYGKQGVGFVPAHILNNHSFQQ